MLASLDGPRPESVTGKAIHGFPVEELISAGQDADMLVLGSRGAGGVHPPDDGLGSWPGRPARILPGPHRPAGEPRLT